MIARPDVPDFERIRAAFNHKEADRVPLAELIIDQKVRNAFMGRKLVTLKDNVEFWAAAGYDYILLSRGLLEPGEVLEGATKTKFKQSLYEDGIEERNWAAQHEGAITSLEKFESYPWPDPDDLDYSIFSEVKEYLPGNMKVICAMGKIFTCVWMLMGFETFCTALIDEPELVEAMFEKVGTIQYQVFERVVKHDSVAAVWMPDDIAYSEALMVSPKYLRQYLFPWYKKIGRACKDLGLPFIYHSDGRLWEVMDDIVECGFAALHPIEPKAMDINELKVKVGDRLCLMGNLDLGYTLTRGTPEEVVAETKERIKFLAPGGGYCVGASNSVPSYVPLDNYQAMIKTVYEFGKYPIRL